MNELVCALCMLATNKTQQIQSSIHVTDGSLVKNRYQNRLFLYKIKTEFQLESDREKTMY